MALWGRATLAVGGSERAWPQAGLMLQTCHFTPLASVYLCARRGRQQPLPARASWGVRVGWVTLAVRKGLCPAAPGPQLIQQINTSFP